MSQKIVITASMKGPSEIALPDATYQWHWRRIIITVSVVLALLGGFYSLITSVYAKQYEGGELQSSVSDSQKDSPNETPATTNNESNEAKPEVIVQSSEKTSEPEVTKTLLNTETTIAPEGNDAEKTANVVTVPSAQEELDKKTLDANTPQSSRAELTELEQNVSSIGTTQEKTTVQQTQKDEELDGFSQTANIANVALGASIDTDKVSRAVLTRKVSNREPMNVFKADVRISDFNESLVFFSELRNLQGQQVKHIWYYEGEPLATIDLAVTTPRYRTYSEKHIMPEQVGHWRVDVVDEQGQLLAKKEFRILAN